jgi:hypothetical protein
VIAMAKIRDFDRQSNEDALNALADYLQDFVEENRSTIIEFPESEDHESDKKVIAQASSAFRRDFNAFVNSIEPIRAENPRHLHHVYEAVHHLIVDVFFIGASRSLTKDTKLHFGKLQAGYARRKRKTSPEEMALAAAIEAERGTGPVSKPTKEAGAILSAVNQRLQENGFPIVKVDKVRRRLDKFPRS